MPRPPLACDTARGSANGSVPLALPNRACGPPAASSLASDNGALALPYDQAQVEQLLQSLAWEFENLQQLYEASVEKNSALSEILGANVPFSDAVIAAGGKDEAQVRQCVEEANQQDQQQQEFQSPPLVTEEQAINRPHGFYRSISPASVESEIEIESEVLDVLRKLDMGQEVLLKKLEALTKRAGNPMVLKDGHHHGHEVVGVSESPHKKDRPPVIDTSAHGDGHEPHSPKSAKSPHSSRLAELRSSFAHNSKLSGSTSSLQEKMTGKLKHLGMRFAHPGAAQYISESSEEHGGESQRTAGWMKEVYRNVWFEPVLAMVIMLNACAMIAELQYQGIQLGYELNFRGSARPAADAWPQAAAIFEVLEWLFGTIFAIEMFFRLKVLCCKFFRDVWNWIDLLIVSCFVVERLFDGLLPVGTAWIRICRLMRLGRLLTLARTVEGFDHLFLITTAIKGSVGILAWALLLLGVIHMTIALVVGKCLHAAYFDHIELASGNATENQHKLYEYFGTWTRAMLSIFEITLANWPPICRLLTEEVSEWFALLVLMHKLTIGFAVVGVINGVFMKETFRVAETDDIIMVRQKAKSASLHAKNMKHLFEALDSSGDGTVSRREFKNLSQFPTVKTWLASMEFETDDLDTVFDLIDQDNSDSITFEEMMNGVTRLKGGARSIDLLTFQRHHRLHVAKTLHAHPKASASQARAKRGPKRPQDFMSNGSATSMASNESALSAASAVSGGFPPPSRGTAAQRYAQAFGDKPVEP